MQSEIKQDIVHLDILVQSIRQLGLSNAWELLSQLFLSLCNFVICGGSVLHVLMSSERNEMIYHGRKG
jgi:hypothetical protein